MDKKDSKRRVDSEAILSGDIVGNVDGEDA
jgi:hypothetical protein